MIDRSENKVALFVGFKDGIERVVPYMLKEDFGFDDVVIVGPGEALPNNPQEAYSLVFSHAHAVAAKGKHAVIVADNNFDPLDAAEATILLKPFGYDELKSAIAPTLVA